VWGVIEGPEPLETNRDHLERALATAAPTEDLWLFSNADAIGVVLRAIFWDPVGDQLSW
jgi:hypothetical protein